jgi:oxalate decarboxylase/phosphoglucose isomerase-like protein (cupin superfamily)
MEGVKAMVAKERFYTSVEEVETLGFDWGEISITVSPRATGAVGFSAGIVVMQKGGGHGRHNHPGAEEIIHVISGEGEQMVEDERGRPVVQALRPGCSVYVPTSRFHSTTNTGDGPLTVYVVYTPVGAEEVLRSSPGCQILPPRR